MMRYNVKMFVCLTVVICCLFFSHAASAGENNEADRKVDMIRKIVIEVAENVSWYPEEQRDYLDIIEPVLQMGERALPALDKLTEDDGLTAFQRRLAWLIHSRINTPHVFRVFDEVLETYHVSAPPPPLSHPPVGARRINVELLPEDIRQIARGHEEIIAKGEEMISDHMVPTPVHKRLPDTIAGRRLDRESYAEALENLLREEIDNKEHRSKIIELITPPMLRRTAAEYLPAWEESVIKTSDALKRLALMYDLIEQDHPDSILILGELARFASRTDEQVFSDVSVSPEVLRRIMTKACEKWSGQVVLREIVKTVEFERKHPEARNYSRSMLSLVSRRENWRSFLEEAVRSDRPQVAEDAKMVKELVESL